MQLTHTRYSLPNTILLLAGGLISLFNTFALVMTAGFGADPVHDFRSLAVESLIVVGLLNCLFFLIMLRWCRIGSIGMWCIVICSSLLALAAGVLFKLFVFLVLLMIEALICSAVDAGSHGKSTN
jgi:hypothetical protein